MLGIWAAYGETYLLILGIGTSILFTIPILFMPLTWAKLMMWPIPEEWRLAVYFGRCLGCMALVIEYFIFHAALGYGGLSFAFQFVIGVSALMVALHIQGAVMKIQPITETLEIGFWALLLVLTICFYKVG